MGSTNQQLYSLHWNDYGSSLTSAVQHLRGHGDLVDVTLTAGGQHFPAHKIVLSAASPFLLEILKTTPCQHPVVMLAGISADDLEAILEFVYRGQISVEPSQLPSLLQAAHCLSIHGLAPPTIMTEKGEEIPLSSIPGCNDIATARETLDAYRAQHRRKKKRKQEGGGGKWPRAGYHSSLDSRSLDSEDNRSLDYGHKDGTDDEGDWNSKSRTLSDQPATCPLCGAVIRQSRNLRRHLELLHFGVGSGKSRSKKDKNKDKDKDYIPKSSSYSRATLTLRDNPKSDYADYPGVSSLSLSSSIHPNPSNVPGTSFMLSGTGGLAPPPPAPDHSHHHSHHNPNSLTATNCPPVSSIPPTMPNNSIYSASDSATMLSSLFPTLPSLPTLSNPHDVFRHSEFLRANMGYPQQQQPPPGRHLQRTDVT
ncbi:transcription factor Ken 2-like isoform X2 [Trichogramma pretiosum]|nr:transcription factor Ken 2-like isoform X2 [Trichogramma pretiosum]XP_014222916.1 transcription factor Ken 2-like isoform X2 [Trichogramma pretiosum]XP_014222923.1 transcription factor Ken 2-like isoform X2 [Trichogramma pretiosum]XP_014222931.1 transcription factor Ken 2-like isoform X2 [Trichogramma pretiosum]